MDADENWGINWTYSGLGQQSALERIQNWNRTMRFRRTVLLHGDHPRCGAAAPGEVCGSYLMRAAIARAILLA
jgi:hypothetical protein